MIPEYTIHIDGSCRGQGKPDAAAGWGLEVKKGNETIFKDYGRVEGLQDSSRSEVYALFKAMQWIEEHPKCILNFRTDSMMIVSAIESVNIRKSIAADLWKEITPLIEKNAYRIKSFSHCPREENEGADQLAKKGSACLLRLKGGEADGFDLDKVMSIMAAI